MTAGARGRPVGGSDEPTAREFWSLADAVKELGQRIRYVERVMYVMTGVGTATGATAIFNLFENLSGR